MIEENCRVKPLVERDGYPIDTIGVIVSIYSSGPACEVELRDDNEYPVDVVTYRFTELERID